MYSYQISKSSFLRKIDALLLNKGIFFSLPWLLSAFFVSNSLNPTEHLSAQNFVWLLLAFLSARTLGMALNRLIDWKFDAENPRTANRPLCTKELSPLSVRFVIVGGISTYLIASNALGGVCWKMAPIILAMLFLYSYTKRFTYLCHFFLGLTQAMGVLLAYFAFSENLSLTPFFFATALAFSMAGADIVYSCCDEQYDRSRGLYSIPASFGRRRARLFSFSSLALSIVFVALSLLLWAIEFNLSYIAIFMALGLWLFASSLLLWKVCMQSRMENYQKAFILWQSQIAWWVLVSTAIISLAKIWQGN